MNAQTPTAELSRRYQALSDPKRRRILALLQDGERCVCDLVDAIDAGQSLLSFHLKKLKEAGLVDDRRDGRWVHYRIRPDTLADLRDHIAGLTPDAGTRATARPDGGNGATAAKDDGPGETVPRCC